MCEGKPRTCQYLNATGSYLCLGEPHQGEVWAADLRLYFSPATPSPHRDLTANMITFPSKHKKMEMFLTAFHKVKPFGPSQPIPKSHDQLLGRTGKHPASFSLQTLGVLQCPWAPLSVLTTAESSLLSSEILSQALLFLVFPWWLTTSLPWIFNQRYLIW